MKGVQPFIEPRAPQAAVLMELQGSPQMSASLFAPSYQLNTSPACTLSPCCDTVDPSQRLLLLLAAMPAKHPPTPSPFPYGFFNNRGICCIDITSHKSAG